MSSDPIVIVGAGIGGLTAGLAQLQQGIGVAAYEQAEALGEIGDGVRPSALVAATWDWFDRRRRLGQEGSAPSREDLQ